MKRSSSLILVLFYVLCCSAQSIETLFVSVPEDLFWVLNERGKRDLIDLYRAGSDAVVETRIEGEVRLDTLSADYLRLVNGNKEIELALLPMINESSVICYIETLCIDSICSSQVAFFSTSWRTLDESHFFTPVGQEWFVEENVNAVALDVSLMEYRYDPSLKSITHLYNTPLYLSEEDRLKLEPFIRKEPKLYWWNGIRFE